MDDIVNCDKCKTKGGWYETYSGGTWDSVVEEWKCCSHCEGAGRLTRARIEWFATRNQMEPRPWFPCGCAVLLAAWFTMSVAIGLNAELNNLLSSMGDRVVGITVFMALTIAAYGSARDKRRYKQWLARNPIPPPLPSVTQPL